MDFAIHYGVDIVLVALIVLETVRHARKGFVLTVLTLLAAIVAFGVAVKAAEPLASWSYDTFLDQPICEELDEHTDDLAAAQTVREAVDVTARVIPAFLGRTLKKMDADPEQVSDQLPLSDDGALTSRQISQTIVKPAAMIVLKIIGVLLCYGVLMALFKAVIHLIDKVFELPVLRSANRLFGGVLGFLKGLLLVYLLSLLCGLIVQITEQPTVSRTIEGSRIVTTCRHVDFTEMIHHTQPSE